MVERPKIPCRSLAILLRISVFIQKSKEKQEQIKRINSTLATVPFSPARDFREALASIWMIHFLLPIAENAWYSISLGRFDQYAYPYYQASLKNGMTKEDAKKMLREFYGLLNSYADGACCLNVGGEEYNEFSELLIECQKEFSLPGPILAARVTDHTPDRIWEMLVDETLFSMGRSRRVFRFFFNKGGLSEDKPPSGVYLIVILLSGD